MYRLLTIIVVSLMSIISALAQAYVSGTVLDRKDNQGLPGAQAAFTPAAGGKTVGTSSDLDGKFRIKLEDGKWVVKIAYVGYTSFEKTIEVKGEDVSLGVVKLKSEDKKLDEVKVTGVLARQEQRGDTTVFNAEAFKVNPDATTEDLIKKMPGMQVEGGQVKNGGETVKKVLVDGKEFFGDDPMTALRNISADMVSKIEVYDKQSDQAEFTGFSDGNDERTINILTKMGIQSGRFGRVYGGYGTNDRYEIGGNMNYFRGDHRVSLIGMLNNINQQNFSFEDMSSMMSNGGGGGRGMMMMGGGGWNSNGGKNRTGSIGVNYSLDKKDKIKIEFSYSYDNRKNESDTESEAEYFARQGVDTTHFELSESNSLSRSMNNRATLRLNWTINENNSLILTPRFTWQSSESNSSTVNDTRYAKTIEEMLSAPSWQLRLQDSDGESSGVSGSGNVMWRHKFSLPRRTLTARAGFNLSMNESDNSSRKTNEFRDKLNLSNMKTSNLTDNESKNNSYNASFMYTEPFGDHNALQINYSPSVRFSNSDRKVEADTVSVDKDYVFNNYEFSPTLSNKKESTYTQHQGGIGWNVFANKTRTEMIEIDGEMRENQSRIQFNATFGLDFQKAILKTDQDYPYELNTSTSYNSILPSVRISLQNGMQMHGRLDYRTSTSAPSIDQLQEVVDVSNLMSYSTGNKDLNQSYSHNFNLFMARNNPRTSRGVFVMAGFNFANDYISRDVTLDENKEREIEAVTRDEKGELVKRTIKIPVNTSFSRPVNMDGMFSGRLHLTLTTPISFIKSTGNLSLGWSYSTSPSIYNGKEVKTNNTSYNFGSTIASNISENVDFTVSYNGGYTQQHSTTPNSKDSEVYNHSLGADITCLWFTRLVFSNHISHQYSSGRGKDYDDNYLLWNASLGFKFFKDRRAELRLKINDLLDNTKSVSRNVSSNSVTTTTTDVLKQYAMLTFTYKFKTIGEPQTNPFGPPMMGGGRGGNRGGGQRPMMMGRPPM